MLIRYQVFISSTYEDLKQERAEVMQALLELDCIPCGMELFPASNDEQFSYIKEIIGQSDYYILIISGKYGTIHSETGFSYTEMEYDYAVSIGIPVLSFVYDDLGRLSQDKIEMDPKRREKLEAFHGKVKSSRLCKFWSSTSDLGGKTSRAITQVMKQRPAVGWVRASEIERTQSESILFFKIIF